MTAWRWCLFYDGGKRFTNRDGQPFQSPPFGVVGIGQPGCTVENEVCVNGFAFVYRRDLRAWLEIHDDEGMFDQLAHFAHVIEAVRWGRKMRRDHWVDSMMPEIRAAVEQQKADMP